MDFSRHLRREKQEASALPKIESVSSIGYGLANLEWEQHERLLGEE